MAARFELAEPVKAPQTRQGEHQRTLANKPRAEKPARQDGSVMFLAPDETLLRASDIVRMLNIGRTTFYSLPFFRQRAVRVAGAHSRWRRSDVELFIYLRSSAR